MKLKEVKPDYPDTKLQAQMRASDIFGFGLFKSVTVFPTGIPKDFRDQIVIYRNSGTSQIVIYEPSTDTWKGVTVT